MRGAKSLSGILYELAAVRGYGRLLARQILENAWNTVIGEPYCQQTQVDGIRRGVLNVKVAHPSLLEELAAFRKDTLLTFLQSSSLGIAIHDIQFQVGSVVLDNKEAKDLSLASSVELMPVDLYSFMQKERLGSEKENQSCHGRSHKIQSQDLGDQTPPVVT
jgi:hypothetical protein